MQCSHTSPPSPLGLHPRVAELMRGAVPTRGAVSQTLRMLLLPMSTTAGMALRPPATSLASAASDMTKKRHTLLTFGFIGTGFFGLQSQTAEGDPERPTVSDVIRRALLKEGFILESNFAPLERTKWQLASRTDKGVHAACAAASVSIETLGVDIESDAGGDTGDHEAGQPVATDWRLSTAALDRINAALPPSVCVFSGSYVRKRFDARESASCRVYEYLLPQHAVGAPVAVLDDVLRRFEGTHRFHNFASGLRHSREHEQQFTDEATGYSWPLALSDSMRSSAAHRSVLSCRVAREVEVEGEPYVVVRIAGLAFVLHQIRHMIGAALAVTNGIAPLDAFEVALASPLRVDVAPLVPGLGLLLDEIEWFNVRTGSYEAAVSPGARRAMRSFKEATLYPHIHGLYAGGAYERFLTELRLGSFTKGYAPEDFDTLRVVAAAHKEHVQVQARLRRAERASRRAAFHSAEAAAAHSTQDNGVGGARGDASASTATEGDSSGKRGAGLARRRPPKERELPGGMLIKLCVARQLLPGPETFRDHQFLKSQVATGKLEPQQPYEYYLDALARGGVADGDL